MNKRRSENRSLRAIDMIFLVVAAVLVAVGGVSHAYLKNQQVSVGREIDETRQRIDQHREMIKTVQVKIDRKLNRHIVRNQLIDAQSELRPIPASAIEIVNPAVGAETPIALSPR